MIIRAGDRVILSAQHYIPTPEYPVWGSEQECIGTVSKASDGDKHERYTVFVDWDNGTKNFFISSNLSHAGNLSVKLNPNKIFTAKKRR